MSLTVPNVISLVEDDKYFRIPVWMDTVALYCWGDRVYGRHITGALLVFVGSPFFKDTPVSLIVTVLLKLFCLLFGFWWREGFSVGVVRGKSFWRKCWSSRMCSNKLRLPLFCRVMMVIFHSKPLHGQLGLVRYGLM